MLLRRLEPGVEIVEAGSLAELGEIFAAARAFDLVLLDLSLPDARGFAALEAVRKWAPAVPLVVLSANDDRATVLESLDRGAMGYITKSSDSSMLGLALRTVLGGGIALPPTAFLREDRAEPAAGGDLTTALDLTDRQQDVLRLILQGLAAKEIANALDISPSTVKAHTSAVLRALNVTTRTQVVVEASRRGIRVASLGRRA